MEEFNIKTMDDEKSKIMQLIKIYNLFVSNKKKVHIHDTLQNAGNPLVELIFNIIVEATSNLADHNKHVNSEKDYNRYRETVGLPLETGLYVAYTDSAYKDIFTFIIWRFKEELKKHPEIVEYLDNNVKQPSNWYYNNWEKTRLETVEKQKRGELQEGELCEGEQLLVDDQQKNVVEGYVKRNNERNKSFEHW
jgi:hypothetical protein